jgi:hypothetical protein
MGLFTRHRRPHLRAVDLDAIPPSGPPSVPAHRTPGEMIGAMVDRLRDLDNQAVELQANLARNRSAREELAAEIVTHVRDLGIGPEVVDRIRSQR